jgi:hypothetical protein
MLMTSSSAVTLMVLPGSVVAMRAGSMPLLLDSTVSALAFA